MSKSADAVMDAQDACNDELDFCYREARRRKKKKLVNLEVIIRRVFDALPHLIELSNLNDLVRYVWKWYDEDLPVGSITRVARKLRATGEYDTPANRLHGANNEVAYRKYANE